MCEAVTAGALVASVLVSAYGAYSQGQAASAAASAQAQQAENNARVAEQQAQDAGQRGAIAEQNQRRQTQQMLGQQRAGFGASGLDMASGSSLDVLGDTAMMGEWDALSVRNNYEREAWGYRVQAQNFTNSAAVASSTASNSATAGWIGAGSSLLSGAAQYGMYQNSLKKK